MRTYSATASRDGEFWCVRVPFVVRTVRTTQARNLEEIEPMARDLIAIMDEIPADSFDLVVTVKFPVGEAAT